RMLEGLDFTVGIMAAEQVIKGDAGGIEILGDVWSRAGEGFRGQEAGRAGRAVRLDTRKSRAERQAEIQNAQLAIAAQVQILRLEIAVQDIAPVQHAQRTQQCRRQPQAVWQAQRAALLESLGEGLAGV